MDNAGNYRRILSIEFAVSDIARSREFYGKAFGPDLYGLRPHILRVQ